MRTLVKFKLSNYAQFLAYIDKELQSLCDKYINENYFLAPNDIT